MRVRLGDLGAKQKFLANKEEILQLCAEASVDAVNLFIKQCGEMAEANWCPSHVEMLNSLFIAVLKNQKPYDKTPEEEL